MNTDKIEAYKECIEIAEEFGDWYKNKLNEKEGCKGCNTSLLRGGLMAASEIIARIKQLERKEKNDDGKGRA